MSYTQVYRSNGARVLGAVVVVFCALGVTSLLLRGEPHLQLRFGGPMLLGALLAWLAYWRPEVTVDEAGVTVVNIFRRVRIPWSAVRDVHSRYGLRLDTSDASYNAWAVSAPAGRERMRGTDTEASLMVRQRLEKIRGLGLADADDRVEVTWDTPAVLATAVLAAVSVVSVLASL